MHRGVGQDDEAGKVVQGGVRVGRNLSLVQAVHLIIPRNLFDMKVVVLNSNIVAVLDDIDEPAIVSQAYCELSVGSKVNFDPDVLPYAPNAAVQDLRMSRLHPSRWATCVHIGI